NISPHPPGNPPRSRAAGVNGHGRSARSARPEGRSLKECKPGRAQQGKEDIIMTEKKPQQPEGKTAPENTTDMDRREFLATTAAVGGAMVLGFWMPPIAEAASVPVAPQPWYREATVPEINAWITIA
ncbi:MAG: hypothetical protein DMG11_30580, partial [Acidobacteria bacterium]